MTKERLDQFLNSNEHQLNTEVFCDDKSDGITTVALFKRGIGPKTFMLYGVYLGNPEDPDDAEMIYWKQGGDEFAYQLMIFSPGRSEVFLLGSPEFPISRTLYEWYAEQNVGSDVHRDAANRKLSEMFMDIVRQLREEAQVPTPQDIPLHLAAPLCFDKFNVPFCYSSSWSKDILTENEAFPILRLHFPENYYHEMPFIFRLENDRKSVQLLEFVDYYNSDTEELYLEKHLKHLSYFFYEMARNGTCATDPTVMQYDAIMSLRSAMKDLPARKKLTAIYEAVQAKEAELKTVIPSLEIVYGFNESEVISSDALLDWAAHIHLKIDQRKNKIEEIQIVPEHARTSGELISVQKIETVSFEGTTIYGRRR